MKQKNFLDNFGRSESLWMYACSRCGECVEVCPVYQETADKYDAPGFKIKKMRGLMTNKLFPFLGELSEKRVKDVVKGVYDCTLCGRCWSVCPYNYDLVSLWEKARESAIESGFGPEPLLQMIDAVETEGNVFKRPRARRTEWAKGLNIPMKERADTVYFVGCLLSYRGRLKPVAQAAADILNASGEDWTLLKNESCCGVPLRFSGGIKRMQELIDENVEAIESTGARKIVFSCPGCYRMFRQEYSRLLSPRVRMLHLVEFIDECVRSGKIKFKDRLEERVTYHDPCELARLCGVIEEPRRVLANFVTDFVELPENKFNVKCCGGGGLYKAVETATSLKIAGKRVEQAEKAGVATLVVACPSCNENLSQAAYSKKSGLKVLDFAEVTASKIVSGMGS